MTLLAELKVFIRSILYWICTFGGSSLFFFAFGLKRIALYGVSFLVLVPTEDSISVQVFNRMRDDLLPSGVQLITTNPISAFVSQVSLSLVLGFLLSSPLLFYQVVSYLRPALLPEEKKAVAWSLIPFVFLFLCGGVFSYYFLIPATFRVLYPFATIMGIIPYFSIDEFIQYVFGLIVAVGLMFLMPLFMLLLSFMGIIEADFWRRKWRTAFVFFLVLSAIITPDGTGITMAMLFIPLIALYFTGYYLAKKYSGRSRPSPGRITST